ncbi:MAG: EAL domain-containing protein [Pseudomonadota bacterium]
MDSASEGTTAPAQTVRRTSPRPWTQAWRAISRSRPLQLALSLTLLTASILMSADFIGLRNTEQELNRKARSTIAESLAVQMSMLASQSEPAILRHAVATFVKRTENVEAASLERSDGIQLAAYGAREKLLEVGSNSSLTHISVPIFEGTRAWGSVKVVFTDENFVLRDIFYFLFVMGAGFALYMLFLRKALLQLDPSQVVPGRVNSAFNVLSEGVVILDREGRILLANTSLGESLDTPPDTFVGQRLDDWNWERPNDLDTPWTMALQNNVNPMNQPMRLNLEDDQSRTFMVSCAVVANDETHRGVLVTLDDMSAIERKNRELASTLRRLRRSEESIRRKNEELVALATKDPLTGLANRRSLMERFTESLSRARRESRALSCLMTDIDFFKKINDRYGHQAGDEVICAVADVLNSHTRDYDIIGRYGGEEYVVVLPDLNAEEAAELGERLRSEVEKLGEQVTVPVDKCSASFGVAELEEDVEDPQSLIDRADQALYAAKQGGRNRVEIYDPNVRALHPAPTEERNDEAEAAEARVAALEAMVDDQSREVDRLREYDELTGMPQRDLFEQRVTFELERAERFENTIAVLSVGIRDLSRLVATFGHTSSDALVVAFTSRLEDLFRKSDTVVEISDEHSLSRITSNEYGVVLTDLARESQVLPIISRIRRALAAPFEIEGQKAHLGANIGIATFPKCGDSAMELMASANDARRRAALLSEKVSHSFSAEHLDAESKAYVQLESDLYEAIEARALDVYFQPKYDVDLESIGAMEALIRWRHPTRGFIPPSDFVPIAEANGMISSLFNIVLERTVEQIARWHEMGWGHLKVSVNISPLQLRSSNLVADILRMLDRFDVSPSQLEVELTESAIIESPQRTRVVLNSLRAAGVSVSMDDFGTGFSSLSLLAELPLDSVKIDRSFIEAMRDSRRASAVVESVINMAHALKLRVVSEGVETQDQYDALAAMGCDEVQGYLISRPLPAHELEHLLGKDKRRRA